jgi:hypothetical protein
MFSISDPVSRQQEVDRASRREIVPWIWPTGTRGVLAVSVCAAALGLAVASRSLPRSGEEIVPAPALLLDVNTVPPQVLETLPHVGQSLVRQLVAVRGMRPIASLEDAGSRVRGLGPATLAQIGPYLRFDASARPGADDPAIFRVEDRAAKATAKGRKTTARPRKPKSVSPQPQLASRSSEPGES